MTPLPLGVIVATLGGLAIGLERQWSGHASGPNARFAGIRTFALIGGLAGIIGTLWTLHATLLAAMLLAAAGLLIVAAYAAASHTDVDATTEVSALVVLAAGVLAGLGEHALASGIFAVTTFFLVEKSQLHSAVARLDDEGMRAAARFAVMAAVILPLLPAGPFGPWQAIRPREVWLLVLFFSGLSFAGYIARRVVGPRHGYPLAGLLGGLISSTNVTFTFARTSTRSPALGWTLGVGVVASCTILFVRVAVATLVLNPSLAGVLAWRLLPAFVVGLIASVASLRAATVRDQDLSPPRNPLQLLSALQMALLFQVVLMAVAAARALFGSAGVIASGAVLGLTDVDALTVSMARAAAGGLPLEVAARAIMTGLLANTGLKLGVALALGAPRFRTLVGGSLAGMAIAIAVTWWG